MKIKNKGKVYPSPSASAASSSSSSSKDYKNGEDFLSVFKLLPAAILTLASVLSLQDREVLAYMITRSLKTTTTSNNPNPKQSSLIQESKKKPTKNKSPNTHNSPLFDCDCFDCYTSYWFRWDSSPNRELIHQVIEAFEEHLSNGELLKKTSRGKKRDKTGRKAGDKSVLDVLGRPEADTMTGESSVLGVVGGAVVSPNDDASLLVDGKEVKESEELAATSVAAVAEEETEVVVRSPPTNNHKGLARKVLPDVLGLFNSRLWTLWGPNV